jgi:excisionase family DNA binding protein
MQHKDNAENKLDRNVTAFGSLSDNQLLKLPQAANYLGMSASYVKKAYLRGDIPHVRIGDSVRFRIASLNRWIQRKEVS